MTCGSETINGVATRRVARSVVVRGVSGGLDHERVVAAVDVLAHWWSRPVGREVSTWPAVADVAADLNLTIPGDASIPALWSGADAGARLLDEHERLFVGPGPVPCPPYESFWRFDVPVDIRRSLMGPCTAQLRELYTALGLEVSPVAGELPDHVAIELEALAFALLSESSFPVARALFFDHLRRWLPRFCRAVTHQAEEPFYRDLAVLTAAWLTPIEQYLESLPGLAPATT
jgi:TorA maturation chaperone TorD